MQKCCAKRARERQLLLDQQDGDVALLAQALDDVADLLHDVGLDALGRLVEKSSFGSQRQRAADRELLLLAAREVAAAAVQHLLQHREQLEDVARDLALAVACAPSRPLCRFSSTVSCAKISRPCGT